MLLPQGPGPFPAIVYLTGSLGLSRTITEARYFRDMVVSEGYALVVPTALDITYQGGQTGTGWGRRIRAHSHPRDDFDFLKRVLREVELKHRVDLSRLVWAGQSDGGFMIYDIACHRPELGVAFAVHAAGYAGTLPSTCEKPVRFLHTHGTADEIVPFAGRLVTGPVLQANDLSETLAVMAKSNGCEAKPEVEDDYFGFERRSWQGCAQGAALDFLVHEGGHSWPLNWMPAVLDWVAETTFVPAVARTVRVGEGEGGAARPTLRPSPGAGSIGSTGTAVRKQVPTGAAGGRFMTVPK